MAGVFTTVPQLFGVMMSAGLHDAKTTHFLDLCLFRAQWLRY